MPLRDHFHRPLSERRHWHAFHNAWAASLAAGLNQLLPEGYFAEPNVQFGIEIDVATFDERPLQDLPTGSPTRLWSPPEPVHTIPLTLEEATVEVHVYSTDAGPELVAAVELVSPANKDREETRNAFVSKCENYLHEGLGLVVVDVVTNRAANLHHELLDRLHNHDAAIRLETALYATAYRPIGGNGQSRLQIWAQTLRVGDKLPTLPLWLRGGPCLPVELEAAYERTCSEQRIS